MRKASQRGEQLGLTEDEVAFYDALETNDSAVKVLGDENLRLIARELVKTVRANVTIDWTVRENVRAQLRVLVKRILRSPAVVLPGDVGTGVRSAQCHLAANEVLHRIAQ